MIASQGYEEHKTVERQIVVGLVSYPKLTKL